MHSRRREAIVCNRSITFEDGRIPKISSQFPTHSQYDELIQLRYNFVGCAGVDSSDILIDNLSDGSFYALSDWIHNSTYFIQHAALCANGTYFVVLRPRNS